MAWSRQRRLRSHQRTALHITTDGTVSDLVSEQRR
jgi:hypothetical protein